MNKAIFVLLDACRYDAATAYAGYLEHLVAQGKGARYKVKGEVPSMSRPMYETLMTGLVPAQHGIATNQTVRRSSRPNVFSLCRAAGGCTGAAAYHWYSDLYANSPFDHTTDRYQLSGNGDIEHGIYYFEDHYPDTHLFMDGDHLRRTYAPDFLLIHSMNIDDQGHRHGGDSMEYAGAVMYATELIALFLDEWLRDGYQVVVSADHGMDHFGLHAGTTEAQRMVPLYIFSPLCAGGVYADREISQLNVAPLLCRLLGIAPADGMLQHMDIQLAGTAE